MNVKIVSFKYEKKPGEITDRQLMVIDKPADSYLGLEVVNGDLTPIKSYLAFLADKETMTKALLEKHGIKTDELPFKRFTVAKMSDVLEETLTTEALGKIV